MMVDVHLTDGRTVFRVLSRSKAVELFNRDLAMLNEAQSVACWALWSPQQENWHRIRLQYLRKSSVAFVRQVEPPERDPFLARRVENGEQLPDVWLDRLGLAPVQPPPVAAPAREAA